MDFYKLITLQATLFLLAAMGVVLKKRKVIPDNGKRVLTDLVLDLVLPCNIIRSFELKFSWDLMKKFVFMLVIALLIQAVCLFLANRLYNRCADSRKKVLQYGTVCSNAGFMGNPMAEGVFGAEGLMYASVFLIPQRIVMWTAGVSYFTASPSRRETMRKVITHPCIVAVFIGLFLMAAQVSLPAFLDDTIRMVGNCTTPLSMILIGTILAEVEDIRSMFDREILFYSLIRLVALPLLVFTACRLAGVDPVLSGVSVLLTAMPAGSTTAILSSKYNGDYIFATKCVVFTTILSLFTIPLWCLAF